MVKFNFKKPSIKLVGKYEGARQAWRHSRPHIDPNDPSLNDLSHVNLPVNGFNHYHFEITSSLLFRDLLYMIRPSNNWARSNRTTVINKDTLFYSEEYNRPEFVDDKEFIEHHLASIDQSVPLDVRKANFPYAVSTDYSFMCDARTLSNIINSLKSVPALEKYLELFIEELALHEVELPPSNDFNIFTKLLPSQSANQITDDVLVKCNAWNDEYIVIAKVTGNLNSQFIRQEFGFVQSSLVTQILLADFIVQLPKYQDTLYTSVVTLDLNRLLKVVRTRSCWFAQWDKNTRASWSKIVSTIIKTLGMNFNESLICDGDPEKCKWRAEQLCRTRAGNPNGSKGEVNMPCPLLTGIPEVVSMRKKQYDSDSELFELWEDYVRELKLKPAEVGKEFISNVINYGFADPTDNERLKEFKEEFNVKYKEWI